MGMQSPGPSTPLRPGAVKRPLPGTGVSVDYKRVLDTLQVGGGEDCGRPAFHPYCLLLGPPYVNHLLCNE